MICFEEYIINSANLGKCNPLPDLKNVSYIHAGYEMTDRISMEDRAGIGKGMISTMLPYKLQDGYDRDRKPRKFTAVRLENKYLRAIFLPELGGRLWSLFDKKNNRELLYKNTVFQPANLALRNAWFSGGVEFNVGIKGHNPLTCSPMFAEILTFADGSQQLKMYEYERIREITYSISVCLPEDSELLYIQNRVENTSDDDKYSYWWSNIAVPETDKTRVIVPADETFLSSYNEGQYLVDIIPVPIYEGKDLSYPKNSVRSQDFFYKIPDGEAKWIASVQGDGYGLLQFSDQKMIGRKLFVWGHGKGGRHWGEWLSEEGQSYVEIQAGLARTQLEHLPMKANECWQWTEAYGAVCCDADDAHSENWETAKNSVRNAFCGELSAEAIENRLATVFKKDGDAVSVENVLNGSGWGALENIMREKNGLKPASLFCEYPKDSLNEEQKPWLYLIENGVFPEINPEDEPVSYVSAKEWRELLIKAAEVKGNQQWYALLQLGIHYYIFDEIDNAKAAFEKSVEICETSWGLRNLALIYKNEYGEINKAVDCIAKAVKLNKTCRGILVDCAKMYTDNALDTEWLKVYEELSDEMRNDGRLRLFKAIAHINLEQIDEALEIVNENFVMCDIQEGEVSISHIWRKLYGMKLSRERGITDENEINKLTAELYPLPYCLDFRMHE